VEVRPRVAVEGECMLYDFSLDSLVSADKEVESSTH
jgi:hypothetical protein